MTGDSNGDRSDGVGIVRTVGGSRSWLLRYSLTPGSAQVSLAYGRSGDVPVVWR